MTAPPRADPPYVPIRRSWPTRRTPRWLLLAGAAVLVAAVLVALVHRPSPAQRASDLRGFVTDVTADIESCAGGVGESLFALRQVESGASSDVATAVSIAQTGAANCSPANNELLDDLEEYQVTESLASYHLDTVVTGLLTWAAPEAQEVQTDVARVLTAPGQQAANADKAALQAALGRLDAERSAVYSVIARASRSLSAHAVPPKLPG
jgi:hypothetical protein